MKNIILSAVFFLAFLPQMSFGANPPNDPLLANPALKAFQVHQDAESVAFFQAQAQERANFVKINPTIIAKHDARFKAQLAISMAQRQHQPTTGLPVPPDEDGTMAAFIAKQRSDGQAFFAGLAQEKQKFLNSQPAGTPGT